VHFRVLLLFDSIKKLLSWTFFQMEFLYHYTGNLPLLQEPKDVQISQLSGNIDRQSLSLLHKLGLLFRQSLVHITSQDSTKHQLALGLLKLVQGTNEQPF
jgi:hypothetical protein